MTDAEYQRRKRLKNMQGGASYHYEYPEFGELFVMLLKLLAEYFSSMFQGKSLVNPENDNANHSVAATPSNESAANPVDDLLREVDLSSAPTYTTMRANRQSSTELPVDVLDNKTFTTNNKPKI